MILLLHVFVALASLALTTYAFFFPAKSWIRLSQAAAALTLISGSYVVWSTHSPLIQSCTTGLIYLGVVSLGIISAQSKLESSE